MAVRELTRETRPYFVERLQRIHSVEQRLWGTLSPEGLMRHLRTSVEISLGEGPKTPGLSIPVVRTVLRALFFHWFTKWPGGWIKAPASFTPPADADLDQEREALLGVIDRFLDAVDADAEHLAPNMLLGPQPLGYYGRIHGVHFEHHFRQYGVDDA
ncbi:MAG TPA: DUF1569 domain-containing protein [Candidatus Hydrogenedentes bacterium]|nr:DUF1569 domain-containing protein [Candidatus Hydrogenedentota bacterium]HNT86697.1 DUF1569 domain-containing protein [Candidatus Hydrogenedentota bacterium]